MVQELHRLGVIDMRQCSTSEQQAPLVSQSGQSIFRQNRSIAQQRLFFEARTKNGPGKMCFKKKAVMRY
jgi:hypothetical protein